MKSLVGLCLALFVGMGAALCQEPAGVTVKGEVRDARSGEPPLAVTSVRNGFAEVAPLDRFRRLRDGGLHKPLASPGISFIHADEFDDAEQLIAEARKSEAQETRDILEAALAPDPAMPF